MAARQLFLIPNPEFEGARWSDLWLEKTYIQLGGTFQRETGQIPYTGDLARDTKKVLEIIEAWLEDTKINSRWAASNRS